MTDTLTSLTELDTVLNDPANRATWREVLLAREADKLDRGRDHFDADRPSLGLGSAERAAARQASDDARGMFELARLAEEFAASTRTRLTMTLVDLRTAAGGKTCETEARLILIGVQEIMRDLTGARFVDPGEVAETARAALNDLLNRIMCMDAEMTPEGLRWWSTRVGRAMRVITAAPRAEAQTV
ncbi:hypothetical protein ACFVUY_38055 [Kitasatospora sp. NPDC058063]|uniref:hypothetical protein n=1 Tax=unclassified Kitasatospora TaxID=2633591 RepID=UPI0036DED514